MDLKREIEAAKLVEDAKLDAYRTFEAHAAISSLFFLQYLATKTDLSIHDLTPKHILDEIIELRGR